jgi:glycosyltransferase involved in cell wall biosynthesis
MSHYLPYLPCRDGFRLYGANLIRCLAKRHSIDLVSFLEDEDSAHVDWARRYCRSVTALPTPHRTFFLKVGNFLAGYFLGRTPYARKEIQPILTAGIGQWDVLHVEGGFPSAMVPAELPVPKVLSLHDSPMLRFREMVLASPDLSSRLYYRLLGMREGRFERLVYPRFDRLVVVSERDGAALERAVPGAQVAVIPNGVDTEYYSPQNTVKNPGEMVFHGNLAYAPNQEAAQHFAGEILPRIQRAVPHAVFHLVGANPPPHLRALASTFEVRLSPDLPDLRAALSRASVYVCPVRTGTGIKNKILEALSLELAIVAYHEAVAGIAVEPGLHLLVADSAEDFARKSIYLLNNPSDGARMASEGRRLMLEKYSWDARALSYEALYQEIVDQRKARAGSRLH